ncbi:NADH-quinone oxidoreductase subunit C [Candidatus Pandoraea novymonadis]|uniref:NADH-quinone oxidoreductase subunit C n=1 Tax=Candidatus Pandoraea novymonadis TaxID=1808959 RepID=A0ABX5FDM7_9BURK|nr:NADH-quinone oxidoreductase subunit C [Candidatus Pandoraea novymonadis]PSB91848.1 NADH-quinone oxidoreductase chain 5 [Candidatus Pandoraea novymonadis]
MRKLEQLKRNLEMVLAEKAHQLICALDELTLVVKASDYYDVAHTLREHPNLKFEQLMDVAGIDYLTFGDCACVGSRYAVVLHLLSISHNWRLRVRVFATDDDFPIVSSVIDLWSSADWFEREAFDLFGIVFEGHPDLRRILTDYGFIGHPFRKDFPTSGYVEMRYDSEQKRVIYQPVTIEPREITPRVIREEHYAVQRD